MQKENFHAQNHLGQPVGLPLTDWRPPAMPAREPLEGMYCRLVPFDAGLHAKSLYEANAQDAAGRMWTYLPYGPFETFNSYRTWAEEVSRQSDPLFFAVIEKTRDLATGVASYLRVTPASGSIEVGHINYSPALQRTRAATEAMFLMMRYAFELGYRRYEWKCDALNGPSRAAALRLGFTFEGIFRQATVVKGRNRDTAWYAMIDRDWPTLSDAFQAWLDPANFDAAGQQRAPLAAKGKSSGC